MNTGDSPPEVVMEQQLHRIMEAAEIIGLGRTKTYELVASGELQSVHIGRAMRIPGSAIIAFVETLRAKESPTGGPEGPQSPNATASASLEEVRHIGTRKAGRAR